MSQSHETATDNRGFIGLQKVFQSLPEFTRSPYFLVSGILVFLSFPLIIIFLSPNLQLLDDLTPTLFFFFFFAYLFAGVSFAFLFLTFAYSRYTSQKLLLILLLGLVVRVLMFFSSPILEDDYYRYLWDGAISANGFNPYQYSPAEILHGLRSGNSIPVQLQHLAKRHEDILTHINHPEIKSIYPPLTQIAFMVAHHLTPGKLTGWRLLLLLVDILNVSLLLLILRHLSLPPLLISFYWLNPLIIKEIFNSGHMDILVFPFLLMTILLVLSHNNIVSFIFLGLAVAIKIWPIVLLPLFIREIRQKKLDLIYGLFLFSAIVFLLLYPLLFYQHDTSSGLVAYGTRWELNDTFFRLLNHLWQAILPVLDVHPGFSQRVTRVTALLLLIIWIWKIYRLPATSPSSFFQHSGFILFGLFFLSPTQFPWYAIWMLPFFTISPRGSILMLTILLPLYYFWHYLTYLNKVEWFHYGIVWLEFIPVIFLFYKEWKGKNNLA